MTSASTARGPGERLLARIKTDGILEIIVTKSQDKSAVNNAVVTVTAVIDEGTGAAVAGVAVPLNCPYVAASAGVYEGPIPRTAAFARHGRYRVEMMIAAGGKERYVEIPLLGTAQL